MSTYTAAHPTMISVIWPAAQSNGVLRAAALAVVGSLFVAICSQIQVPLWPVPITGQTFAALVVGLIFGWRLGAATLALYMAEGIVGLPVFAGFAGGPAVIAGPTGGYIVGFVLAAAIVGFLAERGWDRNVWLTGLAMLVGNVAIYVTGLPWLALFYAGPGAEYMAASGAATPFGAAIAAGLLPFLLGDILKLLLAAAMLPLGWRALARRGQ